MVSNLDGTRHARDAHIASRLASGALRRDEPVKSRFAKGHDGTCAGCEAAIDSTQFTGETAFADHVMLRFHRDCYYVWHAERAAERGRRAVALWESSETRIE